jgi:hypothetical protein
MWSREYTARSSWPCRIHLRNDVFRIVCNGVQDNLRSCRMEIPLPIQPVDLECLYFRNSLACLVLFPVAGPSGRLRERKRADGLVDGFLGRRHRGGTYRPLVPDAHAACAIPQDRRIFEHHLLHAPFPQRGWSGGGMQEGGNLRREERRRPAKNLCVMFRCIWGSRRVSFGWSSGSTRWAPFLICSSCCVR